MILARPSQAPSPGGGRLGSGRRGERRQQASRDYPSPSGEQDHTDASFSAQDGPSRVIFQQAGLTFQPLIASSANHPLALPPLPVASAPLEGANERS